MGLLTGLVAYYKFDETVGSIADDAHSGGYNGDITGATINQTGKIDKAYDFDGIAGNDDVDLTNNAIWNTTFAGADKKFSISLWLKSDSNGFMFICKYADVTSGENQKQFYMSIDAVTNKLKMVYLFNLTGTEYRYIRGSTALAEDGLTWYHIVITYDGSIDTNNGLDRVQMYVNASAETETLEGNPGNLGNILSGTARLAIGANLSSDGTTSGYNFDGIIDEVGIWSKVLTQIEVTSLYNSGNGLAYSSFTSDWGKKFLGQSAFARAIGVPIADIKKILGIE